MSEGWRELNRAWWNERVPIHVASEFYDVPGFLAGASTLRAFELEELGDVDGRTLFHPQCHFGLDTLSWARRGARVTGLDFSAPAVAAAADIAHRAGIAAQFVEADVYDAAEAVGGERFDIVYTGLGAVTWLPDIERWARVMRELTAPGGRFYLAEFHPFSWVFGDDELDVQHPYFGGDGQVWDEDGSYADDGAKTQNNRTISFEHGVGEVISALIGAGFTIEFLHEHEYTLFQRWPFLERRDGGTYWMPEGRPPLPLMYSVGAR